MSGNAITHFAGLLATELEAAEERWMKEVTKTEFDFANRGTFDSSMRVHQAAERLSEGIVLYRDCIFDRWRSYARPRFASLPESDRTAFIGAALGALDKAIADALTHFHGRPKPSLTFGLQSANLISSTGDREKRLLENELQLDMSTPLAAPAATNINVTTHGTNSPVNMGAGTLTQQLNTGEARADLAAWGGSTTHQPQSEVQLTFDVEPAYVADLHDTNGAALPPLMAYSVRVKNSSNQHLTKCVVKMGHLGSDDDRPVCAEFELRRGDYEDVQVFHYFARSEDKRPFMFIRNRNGGISPNLAALVLGGATYEIRLVSADTAPVSVRVRIGRREEDWKISML
jgi:hypothetical protein